jgi:hypothetical protein
MKNLYLIIISIFFCQILWAQGDTLSKATKTWDYTYKNVGKIGVTAAVFNNISLSYERSFKPRWTASLNAGYMVNSGIPNALGIDSSSISVSTNGIKGFTITPDVRYYIKSCENHSPNGFYAALYFRYANYRTAANFNYYSNYPETSVVNYFNADASYNEFGVGLMLGYQLLIKERFVVDFIIIGPRKSWVKMKYSFDDNVSEEFLTELENSLQDIVDRFGFDYDVNVNKSGVKDVEYSFSFTSIRFAISLGYAF